MAKRVKRGFDARLRGQVRAQEHGGRLRISQGPEPESVNSWVSLSVDECEALGMTAVLEDVPEPWERLREAVLSAAGTITSEPPGECIRITERGWRQAAEALGIEPEGES